MTQTLEQKEARLKEIARIRELEKKLARIREARAWEVKNNSIRYYAVRPDGSFLGPHKKQDAFHKSKARIREVDGGNRSGKSTSGVNEDVAHSLGYRPWLDEKDQAYKVDVRVPNKGLICGESFGEQVKKVLVPKLLGDPENWQPGAIPTDMLLKSKCNPQGVVTEILLKNGSRIHLQSYDQPVNLFESSDHDWAHFDEPPPRPIWVAVQRGLTDRRGRSWLTMTPLSEPWIYDEIRSLPDMELFNYDIEDNLNYGLSREGIDQFTASLSPDEIEARLRGRYFHLTGLVYKSYGPIHRVSRMKLWKEGVPPAHWPIWMHIDTHPRTPHHAVYIAVAPDNRKFICGELKNGDPNNRIDPYCEALKIYERKTFNRDIEGFVRLMEPGAQTPNPVQDGLCIWDAFAGHGFRCKPGSKNRDAGILLMQNELKHDAEAKVYPGIYLLDDMPGVHYELTHYIWDNFQAKIAQGRTEKQAPKDKDDHFLEGIHRILLDEPYYERASGDDEDERVTAGRTANSFTGY